MNFIKPLVENVSLRDMREPNDLLRHIEHCARVCYGSENKTTPVSFKTFCAGLATSGHTSVFSHAKVTITLHVTDFSEFYRSLALRHNRYKYFDVEINGGCVFMRTTLRGLLEYAHFVDDEISMVAGRLFPDICKIDKLNSQPGLKGFARLSINFVQNNFYTFKIVTDRRTSHQLVRHTTLGVTQASQRYREVDSFIDYSDIDPEINRTTEACYAKYREMLAAKVKKQEARSVLPQTAVTELFMSGTTAQWLWFIGLRDSDSADRPIRDVAKRIKTEIYGDATAWLTKE